MVVALLVTYIVAYVDRLTLALMVDDIRVDLALSDTQIGILIGLAFAVFYAVCGLPLSRYADSANRKYLLMAGIFVWAAMTALSSLAESFEWLLVTRMGVGVGEAVLTPAALSLISSCFSPDKRSLPISVFASGGILGVSVAYATGGVVVPWSKALVESYGLSLTGWQLTFILISLPAFFCVLLMLPIKEPQRAKHSAEGAGQGKLFDMKHFAQNWKLYSGIMVGPAFAMMYVYGLLSWVPIMMLRVHGWSTERTGAALGVVFLAAGFLAPLTATALVKFFDKRGDKHSTLKSLLVLLICCAPVGIAVPTLPNPNMAVLAFGLFAVVGVACTMVPQIALQLVAPDHFKAQSAAMWVLATNLFGLGLGPTLAAILSDALSADGDAIDDALRLLGIGAYVAAIAATVFFYKHVKAQMITVSAERPKHNDPPIQSGLAETH